MGSLSFVVDEFPGFLQFFSDGTVHRPPMDYKAMSSAIETTPSVTVKDIVYQKTLNLTLRLYKPHIPTSDDDTLTPSDPNNKLPIIFFFRGGGFCVGSCILPKVHSYCLKLATDLNAVVISADYRLAPEHRLPAALDDAISAVAWLVAQAEMNESEREELLQAGVDFETVFVAGDSSGGNMAHHLAVGIGTGQVDTGRVKVKGFVMIGPFFGGVVRTKSEAEGPYEERLNLDILDRFWRLALPSGETRDHPFANPFGNSSPDLKTIGLGPILIIVGGAEVMRDRILDYATRLKELEKEVEYVEFEGRQHGFVTNEPHSEVSTKVMQVLSGFLVKYSN